MNFRSRIALLLALSSPLAACGETGDDTSDAGAGGDTLARWNLFTDAASQTPADGVVPYELIAPLFSDYAAKHRFIRLPEGGQIVAGEDGQWEFPLGTVLVKTFAFPRDERDPSLGEHVVETRLLVLEDRGWRPYVYLWNDDTTEARLLTTGTRVPIEYVDADGEQVEFEYRVPTRTQCGNCHGGTGDIIPLGPRTEQVMREHDFGDGPEDQLAHFESLGMFESTPPEVEAWVDPFDPSEPIDLRARSYLAANCASCHRDEGVADQSGLNLTFGTELGIHQGICKGTVAAGRGTGGRPVVIWPGDPELSIMSFRVHSDEAGVKMPPYPAVRVHEEGADVIDEWIASMEPYVCIGGDDDAGVADAGAFGDASTPDAGL